MLTSKLLILIGVSLQAWDSMATVFKQSPLKKPAYCEHEVGCFSPITKKVLPFGVDVYPSGVCKRLTCQSNGYTLVHSCERKVVPRGCHLSRDRKRHYPHCCARVVCPTPRYYDPNDRHYNEDRRPYADQSQDDYVEVRPPRRRRYVPVKHNDGRGDDYKLKEDTKIVFDKKDESSRRAPWNKKGDVSSHHVTPEYSARDYEGGRVVYYKPDNRGDDYKLKEDKKILYDKKKESSRRAPWNKNKNINYGAEYEAPEYYEDDNEGGNVAYYKPNYRGDDYKLEENKKEYYNDKDDSSRRSPWNDSNAQGEYIDDPEYYDDDVDFDDGRGDNYKSHEKKGIQSYDHKKVTSRRAPWNDNRTV